MGVFFMALTQQDFIKSAQLIGCDVQAIIAVATVESRGSGFNPDGSLVSLFEGHWFSKLTKGVYDAQYPTISYPSWTKQFYGKTWQAEQARLQLAISLDRPCALMSASFGMFQIMGLNHAVCGFPGPQSFHDALCKGDSEHLAAFTQYVINRGLADELRDKRWSDFARLYNGSGQVAEYSAKLVAAYNNLISIHK
jgi:hypothetical protein